MGIDYNKICEMYDYGYNTYDIAKECSCSIGTIYNTLKKYNKDTRGYHRGTLQSVKDEVIKRYKNNESIWSICNSMNLYQSKVNKIINECNIERISTSKRLNPNLNETYFENIDTTDKAYWLGWLITDGCISKGNTISISLQMRDKYILEQFENDLGLDNKIKVFNKKYCRFSFCCKKMVEDLSKYGIIKDKTFTVNIPDIDEKLLLHLLRGCFEGDGGISKSFRKKGNKYEYELSFCGNYQCVNTFNNMISKITELIPKNIVKSNSIYRVRWSSHDEIIKILETLYKDSDKHRLNRKYDFINELKEQL